MNTAAYTRNELADARVAAGMNLLDRYSDEAEGESLHWRERINRDRIDVRSFTNCPLAQTFGGDFIIGTQALLDARLIEFDDVNWPITYGFEHGLAADGVSLGYGDLTDAWRRALPSTTAPRHAVATRGIFARLVTAWRNRPF